MRVHAHDGFVLCVCCVLCAHNREPRFTSLNSIRIIQLCVDSIYVRVFSRTIIAPNKHRGRVRLGLRQMCVGVDAIA